MPTYREGRTITMEILAERGTRQALWDLERQWSGVFSGGGEGRLEVVQDGELLWCPVRLDGEIKPDMRVDMGYGTVSIPLASDDPWLYGPTFSTVVVPPGTGVGLVYPIYAPDGAVSYGKESADVSRTLLNVGNADAWPIYWPRGDMPTGFRIIQAGHVIEWSGSVSTGVPIAVDTARSAVEIAGTDMSHLIVRDDFQPVPPGGAAEVRFEPIGGGTGHLEATIAPTYI